MPKLDKDSTLRATSLKPAGHLALLGIQAAAKMEGATNPRMMKPYCQRDRFHAPPARSLRGYAILSKNLVSEYRSIFSVAGPSTGFELRNLPLNRRLLFSARSLADPDDRVSGAAVRHHQRLSTTVGSTCCAATPTWPLCAIGSGADHVVTFRDITLKRIFVTAVPRAQLEHFADGKARLHVDQPSRICEVQRVRALACVVARQEFIVTAFALLQVLVSPQHGQRLREVGVSIVLHVLAIRTTGCPERYAVSVEECMLQSVPEKPVPHLAFSA